MSLEKKNFLITTPESDDVLYCCSKWSENIIEAARGSGFQVTNLQGEKAGRKNFEGHVRKQNPIFVMFNGHGMQDYVAGHDDEVLLRKGENEILVSGKVVYARSCYSLSELGEACTNSGTIAFVGYSLPFSFISDPTRSANPLKDKLATPCMVTSNMIPISIIKGQQIVEAVEKAKKEMEKLIGEYQTRTDVIEAPFIASCLHWNKLALGFDGDGNAKL